MSVLGVATAISLSFYPFYAQAGVFSFLQSLFGGASPEVSSYNSQTIPLLKAAQNPNPSLAVGGASINIVDNSALLPDVGPLGSLADVETYKLDQITTYTVHGGDTLSTIADMFGVSVSTIYWANNLKQGDLIKTGDVLVILPISGIQYQVKKGDTAQSLAKKFKSDVADIISFNDLPADGSLTIGNTIIIPDAEFGTPAAPASKGPLYHSARLRGAGGPDVGGYYLRPIIGGVETQGLHGFNAVDLGNPCGSPVLASADGSVIIARSQGWNGGYGKYVVISHANGTQTVYAHLSKVFVVPGQFVQQGALIGHIGTTGNSTGCHVHFEVRGAKNPF